MKYALIGCGRVSGSHIGAALQNGLEIAALCDIDPIAASAKAKQFDLPDTVKIYTDHREMLRAERPELAAIATYSGTHADLAVDCINAGCHVIIEKPVALSLRDADRIIAAEKAAGVKVCANHQNRFNEAVQQMRGAMRDGRFGKLLYGTTSIRWARGDDYYGSADWRGTWAQDGGALMNQCIHAIDLLRWMMGGEITEVTGFTDNQLHPCIEAEDFGIALLKFANGSYGMIDGTVNMFGGDYEETLTVFGSAGLAKIGGTSVNKICDWRFADGAESESRAKTLIEENPPNVYGFGHTSLYADMLEAIRDDRRPYVTSEAGRRALETVLAIYLSAKEGRAVKLPLGDCSTLDFAEK
ncbi:MAG: Gfo/Idh/MocA family oxidoreductase [Oscillospiraceae bacterium]|nr:Gfo/Idh/MocA family oxidoreductase [Oscillospiraceae bacterium]